MTNLDGVFMFGHGEEVEVKSTGKTGTIVGRKVEEKEINGVMTPVIEYRVKLAMLSSNPAYKESELMPKDLTPESEVKVNNILMSALFSYGNQDKKIELIEYMCNENQELLKKVVQS